MVRTEFDSDYGVLHVIMRGPIFTPGMLEVLKAIGEKESCGYRRCTSRINYVALSSETPVVFNLGGDVGLFAKLVQAQDREGLRDYAYLCCDCVYAFSKAFNIPEAISVSLVDGDAFGGGWEAALAGDLIYASYNARFAFPEIQFGAFPGMGAFHLLQRRGVHTGLMLCGDVLSADDAHDDRLVDVVDSVSAREAFYADLPALEKKRRAIVAVRELRDRAQGLNIGALYRATDLWVDHVMGLMPTEIRRMKAIAKAQSMRFGSGEEK